MYGVFYGVNVMNTFCQILYCLKSSQNLMVIYRFSKMPSINTDHSFQNVVVKNEATNLSHLFNSLLKKRQKENPWLIRQSIHIM